MVHIDQSEVAYSTAQPITTQNTHSDQSETAYSTAQPVTT